MPTTVHHPVRLARRDLASLAVVAALLAGGLTGCTDPAQTSADEQIQLSVFWWGGEKRARLTEQALRLYSERHPRITFRVTWQNAPGYYERLATQSVGGNPPDLFQIDDNYLTEYAERNIVLDLTGFTTDGRLNLSGLPPSLVEYGQVAGRTVAVAAGSDTPSLVYNRTLLRRLKVPEPPIGMSYDAYLKWAIKVTERSGGRVAGTMDPSGDLRTLWLWLRSQGKEFYRGQRIGFTVEDLIRWFDLWQGARANRATPSASIISPANRGDAARQLVVTGTAAASFAWSSQLPELQRRTTDELELTAVPGPAQAHWTHASMYWAGFRGTRHPTVVADVINFLVNDPEAGRILGVDRGLSANLVVRQQVRQTLTDPAIRRTTEFDTTMNGWFGPAPAPPPRGHNRVRDLLIAAAESVQFGRSTARAAATLFVNRANAVLAG